MRSLVRQAMWRSLCTQCLVQVLHSRNVYGVRLPLLTASEAGRRFGFRRHPVFARVEMFTEFQEGAAPLLDLARTSELSFLAWGRASQRDVGDGSLCMSRTRLGS